MTLAISFHEEAFKGTKAEERRNKMARKFAFMIHPRIIDDFGRRVGKVLRIGEELGMKITPKKPSEWVLKHLSGRMGYTICSHFDVFGGKAEGYIVAVLLSGKQMKELDRHLVERRIIEAILFTQDKLGAERIGLGAYTAPMTRNGLAVVKHPGIKAYITHGDALSAASAVPIVKECARLKGIDIATSTIAVVGAYGIVGKAAALLLSDLNPRAMILTGHNHNKLAAVGRELNGCFQGEIVCSADNFAIRRADIVILSITSDGYIVGPKDLKKNAIVVDMAQPHNMSQEVCNQRPDVLRVDGGYMSIADINLRFKMGPPRGTTFACLTETIISTLSGDRDHHVGPVDMDFTRSIMPLAKSLGFDVAPLTNFSRSIYPDFQFQKVAETAPLKQRRGKSRFLGEERALDFDN
jgi:predicted amino acid dehydrogenase